MIKALLRKQFAEVISQFSRRSGAKKGVTPRRGLVIFLVIFGALYLSLGFTFFTVSKELLSAFTQDTFPLFYMIVGLIAVAIGLLGSVFNAYSTIFDAKDNETLLSLPIPPSRIVFARVVALSAMTLLYAGAVLLPSALAFLLYADTGALGKINALLLFLPLTFLIEAVTLGIAFVVALLARRAKNKKAVIVVLSFVFILAFCFLYFRAQSIVSELTLLTEIPAGARYGLFFFYSMGRASQGSPADMLIVVATAAAAFLLAYGLLSHNFVKFTSSRKSVRAKGKKGVVKSAGRTFALFKREWKLFSSSPTYVMNSAFGVIFLIAIPIVAIVKAGALGDLVKSLAEFFPRANGTGIAAMVILFTEGMCCVTAPCISIEGKRIYLLRTLPLEPQEIFRAKILLHLAVAAPGILFGSVTLGVLLRADLLSRVFLIALPFVHSLFTGLMGHCLNLDFPVLDWTDEMTAIKSGAGVLLSVLGTMILTLVVSGLYFLLVFAVSDGVYLLIATALYGVADAIMIYWLKTKGVAKFEKLG